MADLLWRYMRIVAAFVSFSMAGCGSGGGESVDTGVRRLAPTMDNVQRHVFDEGCAMSGCHASAGAAAGLDLSSSTASYEALIGVSPTNTLAALNGWARVLPGDADRSFLIRKLEGPGPGEGSAMPSAAQMLDPYYLALIRAWIDEGAEP